MSLTKRLSNDEWTPLKDFPNNIRWWVLLSSPGLPKASGTNKKHAGNRFVIKCVSKWCAFIRVYHDGNWLFTSLIWRHRIFPPRPSEQRRRFDIKSIFKYNVDGVSKSGSWLVASYNRELASVTLLDGVFIVEVAMTFHSSFFQIC